MRTPLILSVLALGALSACAPTTPGMTRADGERQCFFISQVRSFASSDDRRVFVETGSNEVFELQTFGCSNVDWSTSIGIRSTTGGSSVCSGLDAELIVPDLPGGRTTCPVTGVRRLSEAELAALPERDRP